MPDVLGRMARAVRRLAARGETDVPVVTAGRAVARAPRGRPGRDRQSRYCRASGWRLRASCTDGSGDTICPLCSQSVRTRPDAVVRHQVQVIQDHVA
jgi:hypothetical protein